MMELLDRIDRRARDHRRRLAYVEVNGRPASCGHASTMIAAFRANLRRHVDAGDTIVMHIRNVSTMMWLIIAALSAGIHVLLTHESATCSETMGLGERVGAKAIVSRTCRAAVHPRITILWIDDIASGGQLTPAAPTFGDLLLTSSGSTGVPKIVRRSAASLDAVAANMVEAIGFAADDRVLAAVPLAHSYGIEHGLLAPLWAGATVVLADGLDLPHFARAFADGITIFPTVPAAIERLAEIDMPGLRDVRTIYSAGGPLPDAVRDRFVARHGVPIGQLYGATEIGTVCYRRGDEGAGVGRPMRGVSIRTIYGEIAIRAPSMFAGYVDEPAPLVDGHFLTGDLGHVDADGSLVLTGRAKLLIDTGGPKVDPLEVEAVLASHPAVAECVVVALRQSETVARLRAIVVLRGPSNADELRAFARERLAPHKVPRVIEFRDAPLPRSAAGKIIRHLLGDA